MTNDAVLADSVLPDHPAPRVQAGEQQPGASAGRLPAADILRGLAAFWVFLFHASEGRHLDGVLRLMPATLVNMIFSAGHLGVAVFFVLSGMVIAMSGAHCGDGAGPAARFLARRLLRLAPPYYLSLGIACVFLVLKNRAAAAGAPFPQPAAIAAHLLFLQDLLGIHALNSVYWTLCIEVQFYLAFCLLMLAARHADRGRMAGYGPLAVTGTACAVAALWPLGITADNAAWHATFLPTWHLFLLGVLLHRALQPGRATAVPCLVYLGILAAGGIVTDNTFTLAGVVTALLLYWVSRQPVQSLHAAFRPLISLGLISYSFYLLHNPITGAAFNVTRRFAGNSVAAEAGGLLLNLCLCLLGAAISYAVIERPAMRWARRFRQ